LINPSNKNICEDGNNGDYAGTYEVVFWNKEAGLMDFHVPINAGKGGMFTFDG